MCATWSVFGVNTEDVAFSVADVRRGDPTDGRNRTRGVLIRTEGVATSTEGRHYDGSLFLETKLPECLESETNHFGAIALGHESIDRRHRERAGGFPVLGDV